MGLLGKKGGFDETAAILSLFSPQAGFNYRKGKVKRREDEAEAKQLAQLHAQIDADPSLSPQDKVYAKANPKAYIEQYMTRHATRQFGAAGGSIMTPGANGPQWQMAPSRHEFQGSVFDVGGGAPGAKATVTPQQEGTQWVTPQPGTKAFGVNSFTGARRDGPPATAPRIGDPAPAQSDNSPPGTTYTDPDDGKTYRKLNTGDDGEPGNWAPIGQGGAGPRGPRMFPGPY